MRLNSLSVTNKPTVIFLFGPTAVGKTECLTDLASLNIEIISADSMQVYRGMDIGTAKPDAGFLKQIPHHLIDIRNPDEQFHAGDFVTEAERLIPGILARNCLPVISGGTAFYFLNFLYGLPEAPPTNREVAEMIRNEILSGGREYLYEELRRCDPVSAARIPPGDTYRLTRALEVFRGSGRPLSFFSTERAPRTDYDIKVIELIRPRDELYARINRRVDMMFEQGLADEWRRLCRHGYTAEMPGMKAIGYSEFFLSDDEDEVRTQIKLHSRRYAKRQMTFFRKIPDRHPVMPRDKEAMRRIIFS